MRPVRLSCGPLQEWQKGTMRHNSPREHSTEGQRGPMNASLPVCWSLCLWLIHARMNGSGSVREDEVRQIMSSWKRECVIIVVSAVSVHQPPGKTESEMERKQQDDWVSKGITKQPLHYFRADEAAGTYCTALKSRLVIQRLQVFISEWGEIIYVVKTFTKLKKKSKAFPFLLSGCPWEKL